MLFFLYIIRVKKILFVLNTNSEYNTINKTLHLDSQKELLASYGSIFNFTTTTEKQKSISTNTKIKTLGVDLNEQSIDIQ